MRGFKTMRGLRIAAACRGPFPSEEQTTGSPTGQGGTGKAAVNEHADGRPRRAARQSLLARLSAIASAGDLLMVFLGFLLAHWLRFGSGLIAPVLPAARLDAPLPRGAFLAGDWSPAYWKLILLGTLVVFLGILRKDLSRLEDLLSPRRILPRLIGAVAACMTVFLGLSVAVRTTPPISRLVVLLAAGCLPAAVYAWRAVLAGVLRQPAWLSRLRQRVLVAGCNAEACAIHKTVLNDTRRSIEVVGCVRVRKQSWNGEAQCPHACGGMGDLAAVLEREAVDAVVVADPDIAPGHVMSVAKICEQQQVDFKIVPRYFQILVSGLRPGTIGGVPILGVEALPLRRLENRLLKRGVDLMGAVVGLVLAAPLMVIFGALVFLESPSPVLYRQRRMGRNGKLFTMFKIRSMRPDAEEDGGAQWAQKDDPRRLRVGAFMRRWNIDELPQFWNVLKGDMSLVGPRPERPELIERFKWEVPHYSVRHTCPPGLTGWAQVNGWRGNTSLKERIRHDIWYVENWSLWLDIRILALTLFRFDNAS